MLEAAVKSERLGAVAILTIDRPDVRNALSRDTVRALGAGIRDLSADTAIRVIVVTGAGDKAFSSGADLKERRTMSDDDVRGMLDLYRTELGALAACSKPVVAAINGAALGGGLELALCCDLRVAAPHAVLGLPETSLGIIPAAGGTQRLGRVIGEGRAKEMILLGRPVSASEALAFGLVNRVAPEGVDLVKDVIAFVEPITLGAPIAEAAALEAIDASFDEPLTRGLALERELYERCLASEDRREALAAFAAKRRPVFSGR